MVVGAIGVAEERGILWFGTQADQTSLAPSIVVASQVYDWTVVVNDIIALVKEGTLGGKAYVVTLENEGLVMVFNDGYDLSADVKTLADDTIAGLKDGSITTGVGE
jgi:basic membrane protein A